MPYELNKKTLVSLAILGSFVAGSFGIVSHALAAPKPVPPVPVLGKAKFVLKGMVTAVASTTLTFRVTNTSKNAKLFDGRDQVIPVGKSTKITKRGRVIGLSQIHKGDTVKVFGIFDRKSGEITLVRWVKVVVK